MPQKGGLFRLLRALDDARVEFIVVGGLAAVLGGAPINTFDLDVVRSRDEANIARLLAVLEELDAVYRIRPDASHLDSGRHQNRITRYGPFDLLGPVGRNLAYDDLLPHSVEMDVGEGVLVKVLDLETLIAIKEELGGEKDRAVLPRLRRTLDER